MKKYIHSLQAARFAFLCLLSMGAQAEYKVRTSLYKKNVTPAIEKVAQKNTFAVSEQERKEGERFLGMGIDYMNSEQLRSAIVYGEKIKFDPYIIIRYIERLLRLSQDQLELQKLRYKFAYYHYEIKEFKKASDLFRQYLMLYPGCKRENRDEAERFEIICRFHSRLLPPRDQQETIKTLELVNRYLKVAQNEPRAYVKEIEGIQRTCYENLFDYEYDITYQYIIRQQYIAAQTRLAYIERELLPNIQEKKPLIIELEIVLAQYQQQEEQQKKAEQKLAKLKEQWPLFKPTLISYDTQTRPANVNPRYKRA